ncbi:MAG: helix-turn-helix domain-containing protein [Candidatus Limnocylindrales bacterium]
MPSTRAVTSDGSWLSLGPASDLVGVDPDTLRRWADEGKVEAFLTPGGHRRFSLSSLQRIQRAGTRDRATLTGLGVTADRLSARYRRIYRQATSGQRDVRAFVPDRDRAIFRDEGRRLIKALLEYLDGKIDKDRASAFAEASGFVRNHASRLAGQSASLTDGVALFVAARQPFLAEVGTLARRRALDPGQLTRLYEEATAILDGLLLEFIDAFRHASKENL